MATQLLRAAHADTARIAAEHLKNGKLVALPTETVYGLGANGLDEAAVSNIFKAKGRPQDNPLILHISEPVEMERYCHDIPDGAWRLAEAFWPGPLTMVLPARDIVPAGTTAGLPTVAVRCPATAITRKIIALAGVPIAAPSANLSGKPSTTTAQHVLHDYGEDGPLAAIVDGGACRVGLESTIVDLTGETPCLLRPGGITPEQLEEVLGKITVDKAVLGLLQEGEKPKAPGMKYRHYAPDAEVVIVRGTDTQAADYIRSRYAAGDAVLCFEEEAPLYNGLTCHTYGRLAEPETLSQGLFAALRRLDEGHYGTVYARCPEGGGIAYAVQNRLNKAAGFRFADAAEKG